MTSLERTLASRLRKLAESKGIPLSHLADRAGIARSHVWEIAAPRPRRSATLRLVQRLAEVLGCDPLDLLREAPTPVVAEARRAKASRRK